MLDSLSIATDGIFCNPTGLSSLAVATMGYICEIEVDIVEPPITGDTGTTVTPPRDVAFGGGGYAPHLLFGAGFGRRERLKRIKVKVRKDGFEYVETKYCKDITIEAKDVIIGIDEEESKKNNIKINISFKR